MPCFKSDVFQPLFCGKNKCSDIRYFSDKTGDTIFNKNKYYSELTGHYWVLKNYLKTAKESYVGFCHYRRFWDLPMTNEIETPSVYGIRYHVFKKMFNAWKNLDLTAKIKEFDIILPCRSYFTGSIINPIKPTDNSGHSFVEYFELFHVKELSDSLLEVLKQNYNDFYLSALEVFNQDYMYPYNMYVMKKELLSEFLTWMFDVFEKIEENLRTFNSKNFYRQFGFLSEIMVNIWMKTKQNKVENLKIGFAPFYMIDFESDYMQKAVNYNQIGEFDKAIKELLKASKIAGNDVKMFNTISQLYLSKKDYDNSLKYAKKSLKKQPSSLGYLLEGNSYLHLGQDCLAIESFEKMYSINPNDVITIKRLIELYSKFGDFNKVDYYKSQLNKIL